MPTMDVLEMRENVKSSHNGTCFEDMAPDRDDIKPTRAVITKCMAVNVVAEFPQQTKIRPSSDRGS